MTVRLLLLGSLVASTACAQEVGPPRPQALVIIDTDGYSPRLMDRLRVEVLRRDAAGELVLACDGCNREVRIESVDTWPVSFGVEQPEAGTEAFVRATLYPVGRTQGGIILGPTALERIVGVRFGSGETVQECFLSTACTGIVGDGRSTTCVDGDVVNVELAPVRDTEAPSRVGTWRGEHARSCAGAASADSGVFDDEVCIRGGTFWMGDVRRQGYGGHFDAVPEHVVTLSPFFLDRHEYSVGRFRAALAAGFVPTSSQPFPTSADEGCNYDDADDGARNERPLNCTSFFLAQELCAFEGRRLPTEAEWEWAAGSREEEWLYPWGLSVPTCANGMCQGDVSHDVAARPADVTLDGVLGMSLNVAEWLQDLYQLYTEPCWAPGSYGPDPVCDPPPEQPVHGRAVRGGYRSNLAEEPGSDDGGAYRKMITSRNPVASGVRVRIVGFRCARDGG